MLFDDGTLLESQAPYALVVVQMKVSSCTQCSSSSIRIVAARLYNPLLLKCDFS